MLGISLLTAMVYFLVKKPPPEPIARPDYCQQFESNELEKKVIVRREGDYGERIFVNNEWKNLITATKEKLGHFLALCQSNGKWVEVYDSTSGKKLRTFEITMGYKLEHGLPMDR